MAGWRMTNNGRSAGLHAPSGPAEQEVKLFGYSPSCVEAIADAIRHAGISPLDLDAMEHLAQRSSRLSETFMC